MDKKQYHSSSLAPDGPDILVESMDEIEQEYAIELNHEWVCPRCLTPLSTANIDRLNNGLLVHCDQCGIWMRPEPFMG